MDYILVYKQQHEITPDLSLLDATELNRYSQLRSAEKQREFLTGRTFLKTELATYLNVRATSISLLLTATGKPYLPAIYGSQRPHFSLSHSNGHYIAGLSMSPIGVDIEPSRPIELALFRHVLTQKEYAVLLELPETIRSSQFLRLFTAKEAFLKATDKQWALDEIEFVPDHTTWRLRTPAEPYRFHQVEKRNCWLTICLQTSG